MIRQAISCDICGAEKKQTNHWFVAWEQGGELRVSGWNSRNRLRAGSKHLCGQACLHKLADDFMARVIGEKAPPLPRAAEEPERAPAAATDTSLARLAEPESSARPIALVAMRGRAESPLPAEEASRFETASRRAEAWERERERTAHASVRRPEIAGRKFSQA